jgi:lysophospholipase L1-like esterase
MKSHRHLLIIAGSLAIVLFVSLAINYFLFQQGRQYYLQLNSVRLDPSGLNHFKETISPKSGSIRVVFYGDSRAAAWPAPDIEKFEFVNRGIGSQTTEQVLARFDDHIKPLQPDIIILQAGINDLKTIPLFPENKEAIIGDCQKDIQRIVEKSTSMNSIVIVTTIFPTGQVPIERRLFWSRDVAEAIDETNIFIRSLAGNQVVILDAFSILADDNGNIRSEYGLDLLHITNIGYARLNTELVSLLKNLK